MSIIWNNLSGVNFINEICCAMFSLVLMVSSYLKKKDVRVRNPFTKVQLFTMIALLFDVAAYLISGNSGAYILFIIVNIGSYLFISLSVSGFFKYILKHLDEHYGKKYPSVVFLIADIYAVLCTIFFTSSIWTGLLFTITEDSLYIVSEYAFLTAVVMIPYIIAIMAVLIINSRLMRLRDQITYYLFQLFYVSFGLFDAEYMTTFHFTTMTLMGAVIYIFEEHEQDRKNAEKDKAILLSELNALRLQMNPHYIYNTLASIDGLCMIDPEEARVLINKFANHLRRSYLSDMPAQVPFEQEIKNLEAYVEVETTRFPRLKIEYDIKVSDFMIPPLIVQPIVENAIKHGICVKPRSAGTVMVSSIETEDAYHIIVKDDGAGFDPEKDNPDDRRMHLGISNVQKRLELLCEGHLEIRSIPGLGTEAEIIIPKEKK